MKAVDTLDLEWKQFNVNMEEVTKAVKILEPSCTGSSANSVAQLHFSEKVSEEKKEEIKAYWEAVDSDGIEATSYKNKDQIAEEIEAKKLSAKAKLVALGLSEAEVAAMMG